jgi:hypothetical protein
MKSDQMGTRTAHPSPQELLLSNWTRFKHDAAHGGVDYGEACFGQTLVITREATTAADPGQRSLHMR